MSNGIPASAPAGPHETSNRRPNIVVVLTDQQRWDTAGHAGNRHDLTPNLDRLALRGTHAACAITPNPLCAPARASLQTGIYPTETGVYRNNIRLPRSSATIARMLTAAGYSCGYIGKWHLADGQGPVPAEDRAGYQTWLASNLLEFTSDAYRTIVFDEDDDAVSLPGYRADALTDAAIRFLAESARSPGSVDSVTKPFFLFLSLIEPHQQNETDSQDAPEGYAERYTDTWLPPDLAALGGSSHRQLAGYLGQVKRVDECLGRLLDALRSLEIADDTVVAFTSDHGSHFRTRNAEFKRSCHDASIRVPLVIDGPGFRGGGRIERIVSTLDLVPTLLEAAGAEIPATIQGRSLIPLTRGEQPQDPDEGFSQVSERDVGRVLRTPKYKYYVCDPAADPTTTGSADSYVEQELYDLEHDPYELLNLIASDHFAEVRQELAARLLAWIARVEGASPTIVPHPVTGGVRRVAARARTNGLVAARYGHQAKDRGFTGDAVQG